MFTIKIHLTGDEADALDAEAALAAAATMVDDDLRELPIRGRREALRRSITISENGTYNGLVTNYARRGVRGLEREADRVAVAYRGDQTITHEEYGRMIEEADERDNARAER